MKSKLRFWKENGKWHCAIPRNDWFTQNGFYWKTHGLIGIGDTKEESERDWKAWREAADIVADCNL